MYPQRRSILPTLLALSWLFLVGCASLQRPGPLPSGCTIQPAFEETAQVLAECLPAEASATEAAQWLTTWRRIDDEWGETVAANITDAPGNEVVVAFYRSLREASWNLDAGLSVLEQGADGWQVAYDGEELASGSNSRAGWGYRLGDPADITGDGLAELPVEIFASNGLRYLARYLSLLRSENGGVLEPISY